MSGLLASNGCSLCLRTRTLIRHTSSVKMARQIRPQQRGVCWGAVTNAPVGRLGACMNALGDLLFQLRASKANPSLTGGR